MLPLNNWTNVVRHLRKRQRWMTGRAPVRLEGAKLTREPEKPVAAAPAAEPKTEPVTTRTTTA
jgi:hypothetical protein